MIVHIEMVIETIIHKFWLQKFMAFTIFNNLLNDFVHHVDIQVKIFKPSPF
jgi:hypothetical protein